MIRAFDIGEVWMPDASEGTEVYQEFLDALEAKKCAVKKAVAGDKIVSGDAGYEIKAAHHGSKTGITTELARALRPAVVVLSYGGGTNTGILTRQLSMCSRAWERKSTVRLSTGT